MFNGEYFAIRDGSGRYRAANVFKHPVLKHTYYGPAAALPSYSIAQLNRNDGEPHHHDRERRRRWRQENVRALNRGERGIIFIHGEPHEVLASGNMRRITQEESAFIFSEHQRAFDEGVK